MTLNNQTENVGLIVTIPLVLMFGWLYAQSVNRIIPMTEQEAAGIATDAYIYGYALATTKMTSLAFTNRIKADLATFRAGESARELTQVPSNHLPRRERRHTVFCRISGLRQGTRGTLVSQHGETILPVPIHDAWMTVIHSDGSRTTGESEQNILIAGLSWRGSVPAGMTLVKSRRTWRSLLDEYTRRVHRRIYCRYTRSSGNSHLVPLSAHGKPYTPPPPGQTGGLFTPNEIVRNVIAQMSTADHFSFMTDDEENPPVLPPDAPIVAKMATIGIVAGQPFNMSQLSPEIRLTTQGYGEQNFIADKSTAAGRAENRHVL